MRYGRFLFNNFDCEALRNIFVLFLSTIGLVLFSSALSLQLISTLVPIRSRTFKVPHGVCVSDRPLLFLSSDSACFDKSLSAIINRSYCARTYLCDVEDIHQNLFVCFRLREGKWKFFVKIFSPFQRPKFL